MEVDEFGNSTGQDSGQRVTPESIDKNNFLWIKSEALARNRKLSVSKVNGLKIGDFEDILDDFRGLRVHRESDQEAIKHLTDKAVERIEELAKNPPKS